MFENIKLIAADIDGTITDSKYQTSQRNIDAIQKLRDKGYLFGLASGRPVEDILNKYQEWNLPEQFDFLICWNGGQLYDNKTGKIYEYNFLKKEEIREIIDFMEEFNCVTSMYLPGVYLVTKETEKALFSSIRSGRKFVVSNNIEDYCKVDNGGIMFRTDLQTMPLIEKKIKEQLHNKNYVGFKTQPTLIEFGNINCNKGFALKKYAELYNIPLEQCIGIGDTTNDNEMLKISTGVCMLNGSPDAKANAKYITDKVCDEEGFADFIEKNLL